MRPQPLRIMLGFVVRQCAVALGHTPTPAEFAAWANEQRDARGRYRVFGRPIGINEARVILKHPGRLVTVRPGLRWTLLPAAKALTVPDPTRRLFSVVPGAGAAAPPRRPSGS